MNVTLYSVFQSSRQLSPVKFPRVNLLVSFVINYLALPNSILVFELTLEWIVPETFKIINQFITQSLYKSKLIQV